MAETGLIQPQSNAAQEFLLSSHDQYKYQEDLLYLKTTRHRKSLTIPTASSKTLPRTYVGKTSTESLMTLH